MWLIHRVSSLWRNVVHRKRVERDLDDEIRTIFDLLVDENIAAGMDVKGARRAAMLALGSMESVKEQVRDAKAGTLLDTLWQDLRYAVRTLCRQPAAAVAAAGMLALGIGVTTAMFTILDALLLRPVPFPAPDQLARISMGNEHGGRLAVAPAVLRGWRESRAFAGAESAVADTAVIEFDGSVITRGVARVTPGIFDLLGGVRPVRGRLFDASDGDAGATDRVLLSEDLWRVLYRADPTLVGHRVTIDGESLLVVGILPSEFRFPAWDTVIWRAVGVESASASPADARRIAFVRFAPEIPRADAVRLATEVARHEDPSNAGLWARVQPVSGLVLDAYYQRAVPLLAGAVVLVFLVLCANVTSLLLARVTTRQREFSVRSALGASRARLVRQALVESCLLGALAAAGGFGVAWELVSASRSFLPEAFLLRSLNPLNVDGRALLVTGIAGLLATAAAAILPAWLGSRVDASQSLRVTDRGGTETRSARSVARVLLSGEVALACMLLVCATLLVRSFLNLSHATRGLDSTNVTTATVSMPATALPTAASRRAAAHAVEEQLRALPGVQQVAWSYGLPPNAGAISFGNWASDLPGARPLDLIVERYAVAPDFFTLYGIPLLRGRAFERSDSGGEVIVGERLAQALWPGRDPIGHTFTFLQERFEVVGLVREIHHPSLDPRIDRPEFYEPFSGVGSYAMMSIRCTDACPGPAMIRQRIAAGSPAVRVENAGALSDVYFEQLARPRASAALAIAFAGIAVVAAAGGLFSVLSYSVVRRRREFGIRTALGASPGQIARLVLRDGLVVVLIGVGFGMFGSWSLARGLVSLQYGVTMNDPLSWGVVVGLLAGTTGLAAWRPARHAMRVDPVLLLREQ
jgi:putative ABC transport system permease protein